MRKMNLQTFAGPVTVGKEYRINIKNAVYALIATDNATICTYGDVKPVASLRDIKLAPIIATGDCYGDGALEKSPSKIVGYDVTVGVNKIPIDVRVDWYGHVTDSEGVVWISDEDVIKEIAFGYEIENTGGKRELVWLLKGTPQPYSEDVKQTESNITFNPDSFKIRFVKRDFDGEFRCIGDTCLSTFTEEKANTFLSNVPTEKATS